MNITDKAVELLLSRFNMEDWDNDWEGWDEYDLDKDADHDFYGLGTVKLIDHKIGHEGDGDYGPIDTYMVFYIKWSDGTSSCYRKTGVHRSHDYGYQWDRGDFSQVKATVKEVIVYE